jgi:protein-L-isoaspartate(D-aspartate) O-methyltransferase
MRPVLLILLIVSLAARAGEPERLAERAELVAAIAAEAPEVSHVLGRQAYDPRVLAAMRRVPRHSFVPRVVRDRAYADRPLPIGHGQTISQPTIVAIMTDLLRLKPGDRVLEIGTGSGYQAAILAELGARVFTVEIIEPLARQATQQLQEAGYGRVEVRNADGYFGWPEQAPFDAIIVTAAAGHVPPPLVKQLKPGGRMVIPVGAPFLTQYLTLVEKGADAVPRTRQLLPVAFVPLTGGH